MGAEGLDVAGTLGLASANLSWLAGPVGILLAILLVAGVLALVVRRLVFRTPPPADATPEQRRYWRFLQDIGFWGTTSTAGPLNPNSLFARHDIHLWVTHPTLLAEFFLIQGRVSRGCKESWAYTVSRANSCPFCAEMHGLFTAMRMGRAAHAGFLIDGRPLANGIDDQRLRQQLRWMYQHLASSSMTRTAQDDDRPATTTDESAPQAGFLAADQFLSEPMPKRLPFDPEELPELYGVIASFALANRVMNVYHGQQWTIMRSWLARRLLTPFLGKGMLPNYPAKHAGRFARESALVAEPTNPQDDDPATAAAREDLRQAFGEHPVMGPTAQRINEHVRVRAVEL